MTGLHAARGRGRLSMKYELLSAWYGENVPELVQLKDMCTEGDASEYFDDDRPSFDVKQSLQFTRLTCPACLRWMHALDALPPTAKAGAS